METLGTRLKRLRDEQKLTLQQVGKIADNSSKATVHYWETDYSEPKAKALSLLARYYNVSADYLLFGYEDTYMKKTKETLRKLDSLIHEKKISMDQIQKLDSEATGFIEFSISKFEKLNSSDDEAQKTA
ncbi:helix-turn-helix domain-containing protein [Acinetobacter puyangensis]|uniref:Helix-turn-helix n=1 Tax=Acinetobacter puyangensis TaxID=1096779 RepID=A0A240E8F0_9GAMM|nr:helix-turn-helix transcriptional regulator [Acinetobacter puyangensis]SNX44185.1 Helix-turn-helix [Acinetobacter puyangensis]